MLTNLQEDGQPLLQIFLLGQPGLSDLVHSTGMEQVLQRVGRGTLETLVPPVYDDVDASRHGVARYSLWAHLLKLARDGVPSNRVG